MLKHINAMLQDWTKYQIRMLEGSGIGYPGKSPISTLIDYRTRPDSRNVSTIVPFLRNTPERVRRIDRVLRVLPDDLLQLVRSHYIAHERGQRRSTAYYRRLDALHHVVQGCLLMLDT